MDINDLVLLLGHSHKHKATNEKLATLGFKIISPENDYPSVPFMVHYKHDEADIELVFNGYKYYEGNYGEPLKYQQKNEYELIFQQINFSNKNQYFSTRKNYSLPFKFEVHESKEDIFDVIKDDYDYILRHIEEDGISFLYKSYSVGLFFFRKRFNRKYVYFTNKFR